MKTTVEIQDALFRKAKAEAAAQGRTLKQLLNEALREKLEKPRKQGEPQWRKYVGCMEGDLEDRRRIEKAIEEEFEQIEPEMWK